MVPEKNSAMTKGERMKMMMITPSCCHHLRGLLTFQALLKTISTRIISQMTIHTNVSILTNPKSPDWAVWMMLPAAFITVSIRSVSFTFEYRNVSSMSDIPTPLAKKKTMAMNGMIDIVLWNERAEIWNPIFCSRNVFIITWTVLISFTRRAFHLERSVRSRVQISMVINRISRATLPVIMRKNAVTF